MDEILKFLLEFLGFCYDLIINFVLWFCDPIIVFGYKWYLFFNQFITFMGFFDWDTQIRRIGLVADRYVHVNEVIHILEREDHVFFKWLLIPVKLYKYIWCKFLTYTTVLCIYLWYMGTYLWHMIPLIFFWKPPKP